MSGHALSIVHEGNLLFFHILETSYILVDNPQEADTFIHPYDILDTINQITYGFFKVFFNGAEVKADANNIEVIPPEAFMKLCNVSMVVQA